MSHNINIDKVPESAYELGLLVAKLRYDALWQFLKGFRQGTVMIAEQDFASQKSQMARLGMRMVESTNELLDRTKRAWQMARRYMITELDDVPELPTNF